jgi:plastocyanin
MKVVYAVIGFGIALEVTAGNLSISVKNDQGEAVEGAIVQVWSSGGSTASAQGNKKDVMIDQKGKEFIPHISAVSVGTKVHFPNSDNIRHHVYSFSSIKSFEIPLYKGTPSKPIMFDKPGVVVLGCNIHDWMSAYVFVTEAPFFSITGDDGKAQLIGIPFGSYKVDVWHPQLKGQPQPLNHQFTLHQDGAAEFAFVIKQKKIWRARRASGALQGGYR